MDNRGDFIDPVSLALSGPPLKTAQQFLFSFFFFPLGIKNYQAGCCYSPLGNKMLVPPLN